MSLTLKTSGTTTLRNSENNEVTKIITAKMDSPEKVENTDKVENIKV